ncbi:MAG TPA: twin-arginine translocation signal domain-containing protein [Mycobacteriales bacterium]|nr:twin-arginine translocation signal domain-containing protein [Mycobacteriales bacterium]
MTLSRRGFLGLAGATAGVLVLGQAGRADAAQGGWRWCTLCQGLWFSLNYLLRLTPA